MMPKKAIAEFILSGLKKLAEKTETKIDDELIENIEKWLRENKILDSKDIAILNEKLKKVKE